MALAKCRRKQSVALPQKFEARFWELADHRTGLVKAIRRRYEELKEDCCADSVQKDMLVQRAVFLAIQLESMEVTAAETGQLDLGFYTQATNALSGLLTKLGLEKQFEQTLDLQEYIKNGKRK